MNIKLRTKQDEKEFLQKAAAIDGKSLSSMIQEAALSEARRVLAEFKPFIVGD